MKREGTRKIKSGASGQIGEAGVANHLGDMILDSPLSHPTAWCSEVG